ncbi:MAG: hypothetical protein HY707_01150 [Ignavibacteriae bacterium]|nr:hypothetical protein [Ignavibacteriota bacterium]
MTTRLFFALSFLALIIWSHGCQNSTESIVQQPQGLIGSWGWVESGGGELGLRTPESEGYTENWRFDPDSTFYEYRNDTLVYQGTYEIRQDRVGPWMLDTADVLAIRFYDRYWQWAVRFSGKDTLILTLLAFDAGYSKFVRKK